MKPRTTISAKSVGRQLEILEGQRDEAWERFYLSLDNPMIAREWRLVLMEAWIRLDDAVRALNGYCSDTPNREERKEKEQAA